ncbi:hypothetical protein AK88_03965 [Plasmodium fragile]|uniref:Uncharacterized protein n=1 Tax=Plasmodium fragile TaxID=5857 RepID=A0A0D9QHY1_PLAFR|nr:uncharacterized protein AK88_03965 [Plasmodium fragile]KJP86412.1 hypothetical protein AK88_03965 [Plasmodium fragile]
MVSSGGAGGNSKIARFSKSLILEKGTHLVNIKDDGTLKEYKWWNGFINPKETFNAKRTKGFLIVKLFLYGYLNRISTYRSNKHNDLMYPYLKILLNDKEIYRTKVLNSSLSIWEEKIDIQIHYIKSKIEIQLYDMDETEGIVQDEYIGSAFIDVFYLQLDKKYDIILKYNNKVGYLMDPNYYKRKLNDEASKDNTKGGHTEEATHNNGCTNCTNDIYPRGREKFQNDYNVRIFAKLVNKKNFNNFLLQLIYISSLNYCYVHKSNEILDKELNINQLYDELIAIKGNVETIWLPFFSIIYNFASWKTPLYSISFLIFFFFSFVYSKFFLSFFLVALSIIFFILVSIIRESDNIKRSGQVGTWVNCGWASNAHSWSGQEGKKKKKKKKSKPLSYWMQAKNLGGYCPPKGEDPGLYDNTLEEDSDSGSCSDSRGSYSSCSSTDLSTDHSSGLSDSCGRDAESSALPSAQDECSSGGGASKSSNMENNAKGGTSEQQGQNGGDSQRKDKHQDNKDHPQGKKKNKKDKACMDNDTSNMCGDSSKGGKGKRQKSSSSCTGEVNTDNDDMSSDPNLTDNQSSTNDSTDNNLDVIKTFVANIIEDEIINNVKYVHYMLFCFTKWSQILFFVLRKFGYFLVIITLFCCFLNIYFYPLVGRFLRFSVFSSGFIFLTYNLKPTNIFYRCVLCIHEYYFWGPSRRNMDIFSAPPRG